MRAHLTRNFVWINQQSFESSPEGLGIAWTSLTPVKRSDEGGTGTESTLIRTVQMYKLQVENRAQKLLPRCCWEWEMVNLTWQMQIRSRCRHRYCWFINAPILKLGGLSPGGGWNAEGWVVYICEVESVSEADPPPRFPPLKGGSPGSSSRPPRPAVLSQAPGLPSFVSICYSEHLEERNKISERFASDWCPKWVAFFWRKISAYTWAKDDFVAKTLTKDLEEQDLVLFYIVCLWTLFPHLSISFLSNGEFHLCSPILCCSCA